jgi:hypothetical protein
VSISELVTGVSIVLERTPLNQCPPFDANSNLTVEINELVQAVNNVLRGCPVGPTRTATPSPSPAGTHTPTPPSEPTNRHLGHRVSMTITIPSTRTRTGQETSP